MLSTAAQEVESEHAPALMAAELPEKVVQEADEQLPLELGAYSEPEVEPPLIQVRSMLSIRRLAGGSA